MKGKFKIGSLFDGSGGFPLAASMCGIEPAWAAEVEPYPIAVTRSRFDGKTTTPLDALLAEKFPAMKRNVMLHLGDIRKINGGEIEPVDIITFGSPCQDLSVAGKRAGLKHEANGDEETTRSGLFMEAVRVIKEMREATNGRYPTFALWENVPGAFSSNKGEDFRTVCEELIKIVEPGAVMPAVPQKGWPYADSYCGDGWSLAYRVFDAQYWGVPQRRRRIRLILDLRGERAGKILFERDRLCRNYPESGEAWKATAGDVASGIGADDRDGESDNEIGGRGQDAVGFDAYNQTLTGDKSMTVTCSASDAHHVPCAVAYSFDSLASNSMKSSNPHSGCRQTEIAKTLDTTDPNPSKNQGWIAIVEQHLMDAYQHHGWRENDVCGTLTAGQNDTVRGDTPLVVEDVSYTLNTIDRPAVAYTMQAFGDYKDCGVASGLKARDYKDATDLVVEEQPVAYAVDCRNLTERPELYQTLQAKPNGGQSLNFSGAVRVRYIVRRLTPTECARLQGFPDKWGHPEHKEDFTEEEYRFWLGVRKAHASIFKKIFKKYTKEQMLKWYNGLHTDSAEYKMWGNGIALPPALFCMSGMAEALEAER